MTVFRLTDYLEHIQQALAQARDHVGDMRKDAFLADLRTQQAVTMNLIIIGEAANKIAANDAAFVQAHPDFPWQGVRGMRNRMVHGYFDINLDVVWDTVKDDFPGMKQQVDGLLTEHRQAQQNEREQEEAFNRALAEARRDDEQDLT